MKKKILIFSFAIAFCLIFSVGVWADNPNRAEVIVDDKENSIQFIYTDSENEMIKGVFNDIPNNAWYNMYVSLLKQLEVIDGVTETEFAPDRSITRAEFTKLLAMMTEEDISSYTAVSSFSDVNTDAWYSRFVSWASENNVVSGKTEDKFNAQDSITREEAMVMLYHLAQEYGSGINETETYFRALYEPMPFQDENSISEWAESGITYMNNAGVISGDTNQMLRPQDSITRAEAAKMLASYYLADKRPTLIFEDSPPLEYMGSLDGFSESGIESQIMATLSSAEADTDVNFVEDVIVIEDAGSSSPSWSGDQHFSMVNNAFSILANDNSKGYTPKYIYSLGSQYKFNSYAKQIVEDYSTQPDYDEIQYSFGYHYYDASTGESKPKWKILENKDDPNRYEYEPSKHNARWRLNDHYYWSTLSWSQGSYNKSYAELGRAIHYLEDTNSPPHAALIDNKYNANAHSNYESWVKNNYYSSYVEYSAASSYAYMSSSSTSFLTISNGFSAAAKSSWSTCSTFTSARPSAAIDATATNLKRTQRAVSGLLYRHLKNTGQV